MIEGEFVRAELDRLLADRGVLVFRNQSLTPRSFAAAMEMFGELMPQQVQRFCLPDFPIVGYISNRDRDAPGAAPLVRGEQFHTDHSNFAAPPRATALCAVSLPSRGGNTQFVNVQSAYDDLGVALKRRIGRKRSLHTYQSSRSPRRMAAIAPEERARIPSTEQPLVAVHPVNRRKGLYLNTGRMEGICGVDRDEADALIDTLMAHCLKQKYEYCHIWRDGDVVIWDNRTVMHKANGDVPPDELRYLYRLMVKGPPLLN